jgi:hypothetical protein
VKARFQSLPFKCNLQRYDAAFCGLGANAEVMQLQDLPDYTTVGRCTLNQVDP